MDGNVSSSHPEPAKVVRYGSVETPREEATMKKALLIAAVIMFVASSAFAVLPPKGYIGLFKDALHDATPPINGSDYWVCPAAYGTFG